MQQSRITSEKRSDRQWLAEKVALFQRRCEAGYDLPDEEYIQWLHETHPDAENTSGNDNVSLVDSFPDVPIATPVAVVSELPIEKIALFQRRYEEGYDLSDEDYIQWLHETHPDADNTSGNDFVSLADCFPDVPIATPVAVVPESPVEIPAKTENNGTSPDKATPFEAEDSEISANRGVLPNNSEEGSVEVGCDYSPITERS